MSKRFLPAIFGTALVLILVLLSSNFNIGVNVNGAQDNAQAGQPAVQAAQGSAGNSMNMGSGPVDMTTFNGLVGKSAPDFTLPTYDGKNITLSSLKGQNVILFFNEGLMCYPSCWNQIASFGQDAALAQKATILNITVDQPNDWKQAVNQMPELAKATVLFDSDRRISQKYGVLTTESSMHKGQYPGHSYILINKNGIVRYVFDDPQMGVRDSQLSAEIDKI